MCGSFESNFQLLKLMINSCACNSILAGRFTSIYRVYSFFSNKQNNRLNFSLNIRSKSLLRLPFPLLVYTKIMTTLPKAWYSSPLRYHLALSPHLLRISTHPSTNQKKISSSCSSIISIHVHHQQEVRRMGRGASSLRIDPATRGPTSQPERR